MRRLFAGGACCPTPGTSTIGSICQLTYERGQSTRREHRRMKIEDSEPCKECSPSKPQSCIRTRLWKPVRSAILDWCANDVGNMETGNGSVRLVLTQEDGCLASSTICCLTNIRILRRKLSRSQGLESANLPVILRKMAGLILQKRSLEVTD